jgi:hypothetical protein
LRKTEVKESMKLSLTNTILFSLLWTSISTVTGNYVASDDPNAFNMNGPPGWDPERVIIWSRNSEGKAQAEASSSKIFRRWQDSKGNSYISAKISAALKKVLQNNPNILGVEVDPPRYLMIHQSTSSQQQHQLLRGGVGGNFSPSTNATSVDLHRRLAQGTPYGIYTVEADQLLYDDSNPKSICIIDSGVSIRIVQYPMKFCSSFSLKVSSSISILFDRSRHLILTCPHPKEGILRQAGTRIPVCMGVMLLEQLLQ